MGYVHTKISTWETSANADRTQVTVRCKLTLEGWYGYANIALKKSWGYTNYIGWPKPFPTAKGTPDWRLSGNQWFSGFAGYLQGMLVDGKKESDGYYRSYVEWDEVVNIPRSGNSKQNSVSFTVGCESKSTDWEFPSALTTVTVYNTRIADAAWSGEPYGTVTAPTERDRYITITANFTNPSNFYTAYIYNQSGSQIASSSSGTISVTETVTKDMYQKTRTYTLKIFGKDGTQVGGTKTVPVYIEPSGNGISVKDNGIRDVGSTYFRNNNNKEVKEIWIKDANGVIRKTQK